MRPIAIQSSRSKGFTLVELLVVIGIIALLISILLPMLGRARAAANTVKCETQLKEIGNAFRLYAHENRNYYPPARLMALAATPYSLDGYDFSGTSQAYWYNFLNRYISKSKIGNASLTDPNLAGNTRNRSIIWGCPVWDGYSSTNNAGFNVVQTGYGMNTHPYFNTRIPTTSFGTKQVAVAAGTGSGWTTGDASSIGFIKANVWGSNGAERMLVSESKYWQAFLAAPTAPDPRGNVMPTYVGDQIGDAANSVTDPSSIFINFWRHGKLPTRQTQGFDVSQGRLSYNILYADGHVANSNAARDAFYGFRQRYPG